MRIPFAVAALSLPLVAGTSPYRGLWVGEVTLNQVNEVTVPLDENNVPRASDPATPTPTFDAARLRLLLHVDATGRTSLLKHVAILARKADGAQSDGDIALVTDERLYGQFPPQAAKRISSAVFDFGDAAASRAVNEVVGMAASGAADAVGAGSTDSTVVSDAAFSRAEPVIAQADAAAAYQDFLAADLDEDAVRSIASDGVSDELLDAAVALRDASFFGDTRGLEALDAIEAALAALPPSASANEREQMALNTAAAFAETDLLYDRFLAGEQVGDMIAAAADEAARTALAMETLPITTFASHEGGASVAVGAPGHGLVSGDQIAIQGAAIGAYNGVFAVTRIDDDRLRIGVPHAAGGAVAGYAAHTRIAPLQVIAPGHGLASGDRISIRDTIEAYNGTHLVTVLDGDRFTLDLPFAGDPAQRGAYASKSGAITGYDAAPDGGAGVAVAAPGHGLDNGQVIEIRGAGEPSYNGLRTITRIDDDSFAIENAFAGDPAVKGSWEIPVAIEGYRPPEVLPTRVDSPAHGLTSGDRVVISGAGYAAYDGEFEVTVVSPDAFTIGVDFDAAAGNPGTKGSWTPAPGGSYRTVAAVRDAVDALAEVVEVRDEALRVKLSPYSDRRAPDAVEQVLEAIIRTAAGSGSSLTAQAIAAADEAGRFTLAEEVPRYPRPSLAPSTDYTGFVRSDAFTASARDAADAAAAAAIEEKANPLSTPESIRQRALAAAIDAVLPVFQAASRALLTELPMTGSFGPGGPGLSAEIVLPATHPTNPFRHRRHPDHAVGFDIRRLVDLHFAIRDDQPLRPTVYGIDRLVGTYDEEIFGLHKPLGPDADIGLRVRGTFELSRISLVDTLNGR